MNDIEETVSVVSAGLLALLGLAAILYSVLFPVLLFSGAIPDDSWLMYVGLVLSFFSLFAWFLIANLAVRIVWYGGIYAAVYACKFLSTRIGVSDERFM